MKVAVMQPYFFPYLGYFQLVHCADTFVFLDDVAYINRGWINRNRLMQDGAARYFTIPLSGATQNASIADTRIDKGDDRWRVKLRRTFEQAYARAPYAAQGLALLDRALATSSASIAEAARASVMAVIDYLGIERRIVATSAAYGNQALKGEERIIDICSREGATTYVNAPGGRALYDPARFPAAGIELRFLAGSLPRYDQGRTDFIPGLSILDIIMRCPPEALRSMLTQYELTS